MKTKFPIINVKQIISTGILTAYFFCAGKAAAQTYLHDSSFEIELNYRTATELDALICRGSMMYIDRVSGIIWNWETPDAFEFTLNQSSWESSPAELIPVQDIIGDIKNNSIDSIVRTLMKDYDYGYLSLSELQNSTDNSFRWSKYYGNSGPKYDGLLFVRIEKN